MNCLPTWLRWVFVPIGSIAAYYLSPILIGGLLWLVSGVVRPDESTFLYSLIIYTVIPSVTGYAAVIAGAFITPKSKHVVSIILTSIIGAICLIGAIGLFNDEDWWGVFSGIAVITGACLGCITTKRDARKLRNT